MISSALLAVLILFVTDARSDQECSFRSDAETGYKASWVYDAQTKRVQFSIEAKQRLADNSWTGIGFGRTMKNGDMIIIANSGGRLSISDRHGTGYSEPVVDAQQDAQNFVGRIENGIIYATFNRLVNTNDRDDKPLEDPAANNCQFFMFPTSGGPVNANSDATKAILEQHINTPTTKLICNVTRCTGAGEGQPTTPGAGPPLSNNILAEELARDSPANISRGGAPKAGTTPAAGQTPHQGGAPTPGAPQGGSTPGNDGAAPGAKSAAPGANAPKTPGAAGGTEGADSVCEYSEGKYKAQWYYKEDTKRITFTLSAPLSANRWTGIGFGQQMQGGDMIIITDSNGVKVSDRHGTGHVEPALDAHQDIELFKGTVTGGILQATFNRQLNTNDKDDLPIDDEQQNNCQYFMFPIAGGSADDQGKIQIHDATPKVKLICNAKLCKQPAGAAAGAAGGAEGEQGSAAPGGGEAGPAGTGATGAGPVGTGVAGGAAAGTGAPGTGTAPGGGRGTVKPGGGVSPAPGGGQNQPGATTGAENPSGGATGGQAGGQPSGGQTTTGSQPGGGVPAGGQGGGIPGAGPGAGGQGSGIPGAGPGAGGQGGGVQGAGGPGAGNQGAQGVSGQPGGGQPGGIHPAGGQPTPGIGGIGGAQGSAGGAGGAGGGQGSSGGSGGAGGVSPAGGIAGGQSGAGESGGAGGAGGATGAGGAPTSTQPGAEGAAGGPQAATRQCPVRLDHSACRTYIDDYLSVVYSRFPKTDVITQKACTLLATHQEGVVLRECCHYLAAQCGRHIDQYIGGISSGPSASNAAAPFGAGTPAGGANNGAAGIAGRGGPSGSTPSSAENPAAGGNPVAQASTPSSSPGLPNASANPAANPNPNPGLTPNRNPSNPAGGDQSRGPEIQPSSPTAHAGAPNAGAGSAGLPPNSAEPKSGNPNPGSSAGKHALPNDASQPDAGGKPGAKP